VLAITKDLLGTGKHLTQRTQSGTLTWNNAIPPGTLTLGNREGLTSLNSAFEIFGIQLPTVIPEEFRRAMAAVGIDETNTPWHLVIPREKYLNCIENALDAMWELFSQLKRSSYLTTYVEVSNFISSMCAARIDNTKLSTYMEGERNASVLSTLSSFQPHAGGMASKVRYSNCRTVTGRLIVQGGPKILTVPTNYRDIISSRHKGGLILELDFKSLEPRIALMLAGKDPPPDVYNEISKKLFSEKLKRSEVKIAVLCALYGASPRKLDTILDKQFDAYDVIKQIKEYFCYHDITNRLREEYDRDGFISNVFGRPIFCDNNRGNILYSNFIQSTASDAALLGFKKLLGEICGMCEDVRPLFVVHDALILDTPHDDWMREIEDFVELDNIGKLYFEQSLIA